jgi:hypothetical protein
LALPPSMTTKLGSGDSGLPIWCETTDLRAGRFMKPDGNPVAIR